MAQINRHVYTKWYIFKKLLGFRHDFWVIDEKPSQKDHFPLEMVQISCKMVWVNLFFRNRYSRSNNYVRAPNSNLWIHRHVGRPMRPAEMAAPALSMARRSYFQESIICFQEKIYNVTQTWRVWRVESFHGMNISWCMYVSEGARRRCAGDRFSIVKLRWWLFLHCSWSGATTAPNSAKIWPAGHVVLWCEWCSGPGAARFWVHERFLKIEFTFHISARASPRMFKNFCCANGMQEHFF